jgi:hypothetical protein
MRIQEYQAHMYHVRLPRRFGEAYTMHMIVMGLIFPEFSSSELQFRFDVLGGTPRRFRLKAPICLSQEIIYSELETCILMLFLETNTTTR